MSFQTYMGLVKDASFSTVKGMGVTFAVLWKALTQKSVTIQYPETKDRIPLGSRGLLFMDDEDCISCRQCANVCPVDCIYIEAEKRDSKLAPDLTKGGVKKTLNLNRFDIDVSLCCYCGLCSAACPTECLYHTKEYEYSKFDREKLVYNYLDFQH